MGLLLVVILILLCIGGLPQWGYHDLGYVPVGFGTLLIIIVIILLLTRGL